MPEFVLSIHQPLPQLAQQQPQAPLAQRQQQMIGQALEQWSRLRMKSRGSNKS